MRILIACVAAMLLAANLAVGDTIRGEYLEARNADIWTGECNANSEIGIVGNKAILAWKVTEGSWNGVAVDGLAIVAVVMGDATFGIDPDVRTRTLFLVDERASDEQQEALVAMASKLAGQTVQEVIGVRRSPIAMETAYCNGLGCAKLEASAARIQTRCLHERDKVCGHEVIAYPSLSKVEGQYAAYTLENAYRGSEFHATFQDSNAKSSLIAKFSW